MRKALGRAISAAVLVGAVGTSLPALSNESQGDSTFSYTATASAQEAVVAVPEASDIEADRLATVKVEDSVETQDEHKEAVAGNVVPNSVEDGAVAVETTTAVVKEAKEGAETAAAEGTKDGAETAVTEGAKDGAETAVTEGAKDGAEAAVTEGAKDGAEAATTEGAKDSVEAAATEGAKDGAEAAATDGGEGSESAKTGVSAVPNSCLFSGKVSELDDGSMSIEGTATNGEPLVLTFIIDEDSQVAQGVKVGDTVTAYYEVVETGGYRITSARYATGELPKNVFPSDLAAAKAEAEAAAKAAADDDDDDSDDNDADLLRVVGIEVEGNVATNADDVLKLVSTRVGDPLLDPRIRRDMQAIYDSGYYTDVRLDTRFAPGGVRLVFRVLENPEIKDIVITGNKVTDSEKLRSLMQTEPGKILNTRVLQSDLQAINKYYNEDLNYTVSPSHITDMELKDGVLNLTILDGITIEKVEVTGVTVFPQEQVEALITSKPGDLYNRKTASEDADAVASLYEKEDYLIDSIRPTMDPKTGTMSINVIEAVLEEIRIVGTTRTKDDTILRNLRTKPGEVMRRNKIQRDMERLNRLGIFKKVEPDVEPGSEPGKTIMTLNVEEQKTGLATIGVGYAGGGSGAVRPGVTGAISFSERNLFGEGKTISVNLQQGVQIGSYGISYYDPAINKAQDSIGVSVYYNNVTELQQSVQGADYGTYAFYDQKVYGATFTYGHPVNDDLRLFGTLRHDHIRLKTSDRSMYEAVGMGEGDLNSISVSALYDTRDDLFSPHHGAYGSGVFTYAGYLLGGKYDYLKFTAEGRYYIPVGERCTIALRGMYGIVGDGAPASEYFYAGGTDTMRGYRDNILYGTQMYVANAEFRFPIANIKMLNGAVFADAGNAWSPWSVNKHKIYADAGVGLRIVFPTLGLGVIRLDYAFGQDGSRCSIGIGQSF